MTRSFSSSPLDSRLDLSDLPPFFVLSAHLAAKDLHDLEDRITDYGGQVTYDVSEAKLVIGKVGTKRRALMELRSHRIQTDEITTTSVTDPATEYPHHLVKRRKMDSEVKSTNETSRNAAGGVLTTGSGSGVAADGSFSASDLHDGIINVVRLGWLEDSLDAARVLPLRDYVVYKGRFVRDGSSSSLAPSPACLAPEALPKPRLVSGHIILERARADAYPGTRSNQEQPSATGDARRFGHNDQKVALIQQTTSEYEGEPASDIPLPPDWVAKGVKYACQRSTPAHPPNAAFIGQLESIRLARTLVGDEVGIRAYSTSIAAIAAYPHRIIHPKEILRLPGCDAKIANIWIEWKNADEGTVAAVADAEKDETLTILRTFYGIWGVGAHTAREFLFERGWRDLDDVVEHGWATLSRVQQIGVKYYDEFQQGVPRLEVERIAAVVRDHAVRARDERAVVAIAGGYRRGKLASGDVDLIVSHPDLRATESLVADLVASLERGGWITHTLLLSLHNSQRGQSVLPYRATSTVAGPRGSGFDTLDKALVVWQDPDWPAKETMLAENPGAKNPNIHRRVDIIVSPWRTVGCAVAGWSGGTTFQRDLRRYCKNVKGWKFDSSGVRDRRTGEVVVLEGPNGVGDGLGWEDSEKKVFDGLGLEWIRPEERCTG